MNARRPADRYRIDRNGNTVRDTRRVTPAYLAPKETDYRKGDALFEPKPSSPAREKFKAARAERRKAARQAGARIAAKIHEAATS